MRIVLVGGGTGGHFYPLIAVAEVLRERAAAGGTPLEIFYAGPEPYDKDALASQDIRFLHCPAGKMRRYHALSNLFTPFITAWGFLVALVKLFVHYPDALLSKGGYTSVPLVLAAAFLRIPIVIHESDTSVGRANRIGARFATYIGVAYPDTAKFFPERKTALVGIPIRKALHAAPSADIRPLGIDASLPVILVLGGSQGAERVNTLILEALDELLAHYQLVHQTGAKNLDAVVKTADALIPDAALRGRYHPFGFLSAELLSAAYGAASLVVSRAGSTTIFETAIHARPAILIPIPEDVSHDQRTNAYAFARGGGAIVMEEGNLSDGLLAAEVNRIMNDAGVYEGMAKAAQSFAPADAAEKMADLLTGIATAH
jgi:UDP-N-acetylglucosamine--N-acetylmuramyl-(pentapeptide) pyrophosphoryl-undecaprenol N-acetylglucosamine transferase